MTKFLQWVFAGGLFLSIWSAIVMDIVQLNISNSIKDVIFTLPLYLLIAFACYSLAVIGYGVATFNDCTEAAQELQQQMKEAKDDLRSKGMKIS